MKIRSNIAYLAIPYSDGDNEVMDYRAKISDIVCADLMKQGRYIYAPISSCHHIAKKYGLPTEWKFWKGMDEDFITICKTLIVVKLPGWKTSVGVVAELNLAKRENIPVEYIDPDPYIKQLEKESTYEREMG